MARMKTFFIYFLLVVLFYIFSQVVIYFTLDTMFKYKTVVVKTPIKMETELQASSVNGFIKGKIINDTENIIKNKYLEIKFYSKNDILMGTKYVEIDELNAKEEKEFEVHFKFNKVEKAEVDIINEKPQQKIDNIFLVIQRNINLEKAIAIGTSAYLILKYCIMF